GTIRLQNRTREGKKRRIKFPILPGAQRFRFKKTGFRKKKEISGGGNAPKTLPTQRSQIFYYTINPARKIKKTLRLPIFFFRATIERTRKVSFVISTVKERFFIEKSFKLQITQRRRRDKANI
ncbi:MAG: hypothetical protein IJ387_10275, partial [Thermoguttaceae bacterium]|nr:hypothetical protein [Thermoguttaceae bacterium]